MKLIPERHYKSISDIDYKALYSQGIRGLLFDIDNTLVNDEAPYNDECITFINELKTIGFKCCIVSNNSEKRLRDFSIPCGIEYAYKVSKPKKDGYLKAMDIIDTNKSNTIMIGDQLLTDILGAHNADIKAFLVDPINRKDERFHIKLKRLIEHIVIFFNKEKFNYY